MASGSQVLDSLDHPIVFLFFVTIGVIATTSLMTWGFKRAGLPGPAALTQHP